ncbi:MAG: GFA family protein [Caldimonas sp.]
MKFSVRSAEPYPFMRCYCSICRKTAGSGGYAINLGADAATLKVLKGKRSLRVYRAIVRDGDGEHTSSGERHFCSRCGSALWLWDPSWPELVHPHAGAIDTPLPKPPDHVHNHARLESGVGRSGRIAGRCTLRLLPRPGAGRMARQARPDLDRWRAA